jgi:hypothetical protein
MSPSTPLTVSSQLSTDVLSTSSSLPSSSLPSSLPSSLSVVLQTKKRLNLSDDEEKPTKTAKERKLAAYDIDWFDSAATKHKTLKHVSIKNLPATQEEQLSFLLGKYLASDIKTAFADTIGKVGKAARKAFYPLPLRKEKLINNFLDLIFDGKSMMVNNSKNSFR